MDFNSQLSRMKGLMTYGGKICENAKPISTSTLEYRAKAADGKTYGIIRECSKFYIKSAKDGMETIAESYSYLGGINNKKAYEYDSYANALKQFELKLASIKEAKDSNVVITTLNPFRANEALLEGTKKMKDSIARQRQIMYNSAMIMNESTTIGKTPFTSQPESEHENSGDEDQPFVNGVTPDMEFDGKTSKCPKCEGEPYDKGAKCGAKAEKGKDVSVEGSVAAQHPTGGKVVRVNEGLEEESGENYSPSELKDLLEDNLVRFTYIKKDGSERHAYGTRNPEIMEEYGVEEPVNREQPEGIIKYVELDPDKVSPDDQKAGRFWKTCFEDRVKSIEEVISVEEVTGGSDNEERQDVSDEGELDEEELSGLDEIDNTGDDEDDELGDDEGDELGDDEGDELGDDEGDELGDDEDDELGDDEGDELGDDEGDELGDEVDESDPESVRSEIERLQGILSDLEGEGNEDFSGDNENGDTDNEDLDDEEETGEGDEKGETTDGEEEHVDEECEEESCENECGMMNEEKRKELNRLAMEVAKSVLLREEATRLNDFGKHPGYRKKPIELPETGQDSNQFGKDWNDNSVHNQEPYGQKKGDSKPYVNVYKNDALAMKISQTIMSDVKKRFGDKQLTKNQLIKISENVMRRLFGDKK